MNGDLRKTRFDLGREPAVAAFAGAVVLYVAGVAAVQRWQKVDLPSGLTEYPTAQVVWRGTLIPTALGLLAVLAVITWARGWSEVARDDRPVHRVVWWIPFWLISVSLVELNVRHLAGESPALVLSLAAAGVLVGCSEELLFRGLGVVLLRRARWSEAKVGLWTTAAFAAAHLSNAGVLGTNVLWQVALAASIGYPLYLARRVSRGLALPVFIHALWDFSVDSSNSGLSHSSPIDRFLMPSTAIAMCLLSACWRRQIELPITPVVPLADINQDSLRPPSQEHLANSVPPPAATRSP